MVTPDLLQNVPLLAPLNEDELAEVAACVADIHLNAGEWLVNEGEIPAFYILLSGDLEMTKNLACSDQVINHYHPGEHFGELSLLVGSTMIVNLRALNEARVLKMNALDFHRLILHSDKLSAGVFKTMGANFAKLQTLATQLTVNTTLLVGQADDLACYRVRQFLSGNRVPFHTLDPDDPHNAEKIPESVGNGPYPAVVLRDGSVIHAPTQRELAERLGFRTTPSRTQYDVVIVGGGPAGLAAAVYGASEGLTTLMVEQEAPGGQAGTSSRIENYLGFPTGLSGGELGARAIQQAKRFGTEILVARCVTGIDTAPSPRALILDGGDRIQARTIILATGVVWRSLQVPGADALIGRGIYYGAARTEAMGVRGKDVYLIGGGNSAGQAAMFFADYANHVTLLIRASSIEKGMSQYLINQLATKKNVSVRVNASVVEIEGEAHLQAITVADSLTKRCERFETDSLFVFIGADAETRWLPESIARDERGYVLTGLDAQNSGLWEIDRDPFLLETSVPCVFAAGDVRHGSIKRVASGVGEGSMAIAFVHQCLALNP